MRLFALIFAVLVCLSVPACKDTVDVDVNAKPKCPCEAKKVCPCPNDHKDCPKVCPVK